MLYHAVLTGSQSGSGRGERAADAEQYMRDGAKHCRLQARSRAAAKCKHHFCREELGAAVVLVCLRLCFAAVAQPRHHLRPSSRQPLSDHAAPHRTTHLPPSVLASSTPRLSRRPALLPSSAVAFRTAMAE